MLSLLKHNSKLDTYVLEANPVIKDRFQERIQDNLLKDVNDIGIPGIQVSIIDKGKAYDLSIGTVDYDRRLKITNDNILRVGSITKLYTSTIIMKLYEEGLLSLDTTIERWFPDIPNAKNITVKNLLNHTSGIYSYTDNYSFLAKTALFPQKVWKPNEIYQNIIKGKPYFKPREKHYYSNSNFLLLGLLAEKITGKKYNELLNEIILNPLQIKNTYFLPYDKAPELLVTGYDRDLIPLGIHKIEPDNKAWASAAYSAGGIASNTIDLGQFLQGLFTYRIIKKETVEKMMKFENFTDEDIPEQTGYGLGVRKLMIGNDVLIGHTGTIPGFGGAAFYCPERDYYITILGNLSNLKQTRLLHTIVKIIDE